MKKVTFYIGKTTKDFKYSLTTSEITALFDNEFEAYTVIECDGRYQRNSEKSLMIIIYTDKQDVELIAFCSYLDNILMQDCIGLEIVNNCNIQFI